MAHAEPALFELWITSTVAD